MVVAVDLDGTVCDLMTPWRRYYEEHFLESMPTPIRWDFLQDLSPYRRDFMQKFLEMPGLFENLKLFPHAAEGVRKLADEHDVYFVTSPAGPESCKGKMKWCNEYFPGIPVVLLHDKHRFNYDVIIDDHPTHAAWAVANNKVSFGLKHTWNERFASSYNGGLLPVSSAWKELPKRVGGLSWKIKTTSETCCLY